MTDDQRSLVQRLTAAATAKGVDWTDGLNPDFVRAVLYDWTVWARPAQLAPSGDWRIWLILAGRGFGKTRSGAEWIRQQVESDRARRIALVGATAADVRDTMIEGESGLLRVFPEEQRPRYEPSKRRVTFHNGAIATTYSADEPDRLRGPNHDLAWADEVAAWRYPEAWDQLMFGLRIGKHPRAAATTTPRPTRLIRSLVERSDTVTTRGSTYDNAVNLSTAFLDEMRDRYEGTRLGRQELNAELLPDADGALWTRDLLDDARASEAPEMNRIIVAVDPAVTSTAASDETGIVVAGADPSRTFWVLEDASLRTTPDGWVRQVITEYERWSADCVLVEANQGGDAWRDMIHNVDPTVNVRNVHASMSKRLRAEPVAALYEQGRVHHVGLFTKLEDQMVTWTPFDKAVSPDRIDALCWAIGELDRAFKKARPVVPLGDTRQSPWKIR